MNITDVNNNDEEQQQKLIPITIIIKLDNFPEDNKWNFNCVTTTTDNITKKETTTKKLYENIDLTSGEYDYKAPQYSTFNETYYIPIDSECTLTIVDIYGDGIDCLDKEVLGCYQVYYYHEDLIAAGCQPHKFDSSSMHYYDTLTFSVPEPFDDNIGTGTMSEILLPENCTSTYDDQSATYLPSSSFANPWTPSVVPPPGPTVVPPTIWGSGGSQHDWSMPSPSPTYDYYYYPTSNSDYDTLDGNGVGILIFCLFFIFTIFALLIMYKNHTGGSASITQSTTNNSRTNNNNSRIREQRTARITTTTGAVTRTSSTTTAAVTSSGNENGKKKEELLLERRRSIERKLLICQVVSFNNDNTDKENKANSDDLEKGKLEKNGVTAIQIKPDMDGNTDVSTSTRSMSSLRSMSERFYNGIVGNITNTSTTTPQQCDICLDTYEDGDIISYSRNEDCVHVFHKDCIVDWLLSKEGERPSTNNANSRRQRKRGDPTCPCCRRNFLITNKNEVDC